MPIYVHAEELQRPIIDEVEASKGRRTHVARFTTLTQDALRDQMSRAAKWRKWSERKQGYVAADPPRDVAAIVLSRKGEWNFLPATGVITTPTLRPDGSILSAEGYDPVTRLILMRPPSMPENPDSAEQGQRRKRSTLARRPARRIPFRGRRFSFGCSVGTDHPRGARGDVRGSDARQSCPCSR